MGRSEYIPWAPEEEARLLPFMKRHGHLPWEIIGEEYVRETGIPRKKHSLRGKVGQLQKGHRRQRPISQKAAELHFAAARRAARRWQRVSDLLPASPPPLSLKEPDPQSRRLLQQMRQLSLQTCPRYGASIANGIDHSPPRGAHRPSEYAHPWCWRSLDHIVTVLGHHADNRLSRQCRRRSAYDSHGFWKTCNFIIGASRLK